VGSRANIIGRDAGYHRPQTFGNLQGTGNTGFVYEDDVSDNKISWEAGKLVGWKAGKLGGRETRMPEGRKARKPGGYEAGMT